VTASRWQDALGFAFGMCALPLFCALFLIACLTVLAVPGLERRRRIVRGFARTGLAVIGLRVSITGLDRLPAESCVIVANHASYLDGVVMKAMLPPRFSFVIKREAARMPLAGALLKLIGSEFIDRHNHGDRHKDARRVMRRAEQGHSLVFFPEGTFFPEPGLRRFHLGAFTTAARAGCPVVPVVIRGARRALRSDRLIPRPGRIEIEVLEPLPAPTTRATLEPLRDESRRRILARLGEPDLQHAAQPDAVAAGAT
jgi:1-acyl-sn-glycerol-3-phosphate acyltransferase